MSNRPDQGSVTPNEMREVPPNSAAASPRATKTRSPGTIGNYDATITCSKA